MRSSWVLLAVITATTGLAVMAVTVGRGGGIGTTTIEENIKKDRGVQRPLAMEVDGGGEGRTTTVDNIKIEDQVVQRCLAMAVGREGDDGTTTVEENVKNDQRLHRGIDTGVDGGTGGEKTRAVEHIQKDQCVQKGRGRESAADSYYSHPSAGFHNTTQMKPGVLFQEAIAVERRRLPTDYSLRARFGNRHRRPHRHRSHAHPSSRDCSSSIGGRALGLVRMFWGFVLTCAALQGSPHY